jgi:AraC-like DNA-binding protein
MTPAIDSVHGRCCAVLRLLQHADLPAMFWSLINLPGVVTTVRLKMELLRDLSRSSVEEWLECTDRFVDAVAASELKDPTALWVLLADLTEQMRALLSHDAVVPEGDGQWPDTSRVDALSKGDVLMLFRDEVAELLDEVVRDHEPSSPLVVQMLSLIEERYAEPLTLDVLAAALGRSKRYLATLFHHQTGQTVHEFLTQVRLHHAAALIRTGEKIEAVSLLVGYRSKKNFYRHFKDELGVTPTVYRTTLAGRMRRID